MTRKKKASPAGPPREMAAVMFTDVRGYSDLTQKDEALAIRLLDLQDRIAAPLIAKHRGRLVKTIGDALMVEFRSALAAVECAAELQEQLAERNRAVPAQERLLVRIGVHLGDVIRKGDDLLGDTVNIAARVEPQASPGGVAITQAVHEQIKGKFHKPLLPLGPFKLKGIEGEVSLYAVGLPGAEGTVPAKSRPGLIARLRQHHMFRTASWYATAAYVLVLAANAVFPDVGLTRADVRYLIAALALGFPVALTLGWIFVPPSREDPATFGRWQRLRFRTGAAAALAVLVFVTGSGLYLWRLDTGHVRTTASSGVTRSIAVLPLRTDGAVDAAMAAGMRAHIEGALSDIGSVRLLADAAAPAAAGGDAAGDDAAKLIGADLVLEGSISRPRADAEYTVDTKLISVRDAATLYSDSEQYPAQASAEDIETQEATIVAGPVHLLTGADAWLAAGFPTTDNPRAMTLLRQAMVSMRYRGVGNPEQPQLLRGAIALDPAFAQAHAYLAFLEAFSPEPGLADPKALVQGEIAKADALVPGLPEATLAEAAEDAWIEGDWAKAAKTADQIAAPLAQDPFLHIVAGSALHEVGRYQDALREFDLASQLDPYQFNQVSSIPLLEYQLHDYEGAERTFAVYLKRWPLSRALHRWQASAEFAQHGDVAALEAALAPDKWLALGVPADDPTMLSMRIEALHLAGRHAAVIDALRRYPDECLLRSGYPALSLEEPCVPWLTAESLRLLGHDSEAASIAALQVPQAARELAAKPGDDFLILHLALLQVFGGDAKAALATVAPLYTRLEHPAAQWSEYDAESSQSVAAVLAWAGKKDEAISLLGHALDVPFGAHAAIVAHDPVWRPLYTDPAFKALLASRGQVLAYVK